MTSVSRPRILIVAGHDSSGGAGVDADRESVHELPITPLVVVTAFTQQDATAVHHIEPRPSAEWMDEALALAESGVNAVKFGLLARESDVASAAQLVMELRRRTSESLPIVVDPVIRASSGSRFMDEAATDALCRHLLALGVITTPNLGEAAELARMPLEDMVLDPERRIEAARKLLAHGANTVIVKGGHGAEDPVRDLIARSGRPPVWHEHRRIAGGKIRGSGCRYATRLAAGLALGKSIEESARESGEYVARLIRESTQR